jgi:hypothetical protein
MKSTVTAFAFVLCAALTGAEEKELEGYVTDDMCAKEHMMDGMSDKECADECVKMGAVYALFVPDEGKMYLADDPKKLEPHAGQSVVVKGTISADGKSIQVSSVRKAEPTTR